MLMMLASPILLLTIAHVLFPSKPEHADLGEFYFANPNLPWRLAALTVIVSTLFRTIAFGDPLLVQDNATGIPILLICIVLGTTRKRIAHYILVPMVAVLIILDTLFINYMIR